MNTSKVTLKLVILHFQLVSPPVILNTVSGGVHLTFLCKCWHMMNIVPRYLFPELTLNIFVHCTAYLCLLCFPIVWCSCNVSCLLLTLRANSRVFFDNISYREVLSERKFLVVCRIVQNYRGRLRLHQGNSSSLFAFLHVNSNAI